MQILRSKIQKPTWCNTDDRYHIRYITRCLGFYPILYIWNNVCWELSVPSMYLHSSRGLVSTVVRILLRAQQKKNHIHGFSLTCKKSSRSLPMWTRSMFRSNRKTWTRLPELPASKTMANESEGLRSGETFRCVRA